MEQGRDLHSEVAASAFRLPPVATLQGVLDELDRGNSAPYKQWNKEFKAAFEFQRIAAKTVNFGIMYGKQANSLARDISAQGIPTTREGAQAMIDALAEKFPTAVEWLERGAEIAVRDERLEIPGGRCRYYSGISKMGRGEQAACGRQSKNCRIQGVVAYLLDRAIIELRRIRYNTELGRRIGYRVILPIHDALLVEFPTRFSASVADLIQYAMSDNNPLPGTDKRLGVDLSKPMTRWSDHH